jgi:hypothetical protein
MKPKTFNLTLFILTINISLIDSGCAEPNEYELRVNKIVNYLKNNSDINLDSCKSIYILQANKCNTCNEEFITFIIKEISETKSENVLVLNGFNDRIFDLLVRKQQEYKFRMVVDDNGELDRLGLSFMTNIFVSVCRNKVINWKFYEK